MLLVSNFKNKKGLFLYLVEHTRDLLEKKVASEIEMLAEDDYFERIKKIMIIKYKVALKNKSQGTYGNFDEFLEELEFFNDIIKYGVMKK